MPFRTRALMFHERWATAERWTYMVCALLLTIVLRRGLLPEDWPYGFLPFAITVPAVYFLFGRGPGVAFLLLSGLAALHTAGQDTLTLPNARDFALYVLQGGICCWLIDQLQRSLLVIQQDEHLKDELLRTQTDWVMRLDAKGHFTYLNPAAAETFGLSAEEAVGMHWHPLALAEDLPDIEAKLATLDVSNPVVTSENRILNAKGEVIWGHFIHRGIFDEAGALTGVLSVGRNITDHKQLERQLSDLAQEHEDLYQRAPCAYFSIDAVGTFLKVNDRLCEWLGVSAAELVDKRRLSEFFTAEEAERFRLDYPRFMQEGTLKDVELELQHRDGSSRSVAVEANAVIDAQGHYVHSRSVMTDITARKRAEREVQRLNEALELRVQERTAELTRATEELESFTYSLSHDLRAPIRSINSTASILLEEHQSTMSAELQDGLEKIGLSSQRMARLMDAMLALSALASPSAPVLSCSHTTLVQEALDNLLPPDSPRRAQISINALPTVEGNPRRIQRIWENLLSNALKFTSLAPEPRIEVGYDATIHACYVRDNGVGFDMRYADKVFKPFEKLHDDKQFEGAGIGLAIADKIARLNGGRIWCESAPGQGAAFYFTLREPEAEPTP